MDAPFESSRASTAESLLRFDVAAALVIGELGLGKTTLLRDVAGQCPRAVRFITCRSSAGTIPFEPLQTLLNGLRSAGQPENELRLSSSADAILARDALARAAAEQPRLLILDDLQWADGQTLRVLPYLVDRLQDYPIVWIFAARPGYKNVEVFRTELLRTNVARIVELSPLSNDEILGALARLGFDANADVESIVTQARGNPLFAALLASSRGRSSASAETAVIEQVEALDERDRQTAQAIAVANRAVTVEALSVLLRRSATLVERSVNDLVGLRVAVRAGAQIELSHPVWSTALVASTPVEELSALHAVLATQALDLDERARHLLAAGRHDAAREAFAMLAWRSLLSNRTLEARNYSALALTAEAPGTSALSMEESLTALLHLTTRFSDAHSEALAVTVRIEAWQHLAPEVEARLELAHSIFFRTLWSNTDEAQRLLQIADFADEPAIKAQLLYRVAIIHVWLRNWESVTGVTASIDAISRTAALPAARLLGATVRAFGVGIRGDFDESLNLLERIFDEADALNESEATIEAAYRACQIAIYSGRERRVLPLCERIQQIQDTPWAKRHFLANSLGVLWQNLGNYEAALTVAYSLGDDLSDLDSGSRGLPTFIKVSSSSYLGLFSDAAKTLEAWTASGTPDRLGLVAWAAGNFYELTQQYERALPLYGEVIRKHALGGTLGNDLLAALALHRIAYATRDVATHRLALDQAHLFERAKTEYPTFYALHLGYVAAYDGRTTEASKHLREGASLPGLSPFERALVLLTVAEIDRDLALLESCAATFQDAGSGFMVDRTMELAAQLKIQARPPKHQGPLTQRERSVAVLLAAGKTNPEIADELGISRRTVETHVANILIKLGLRSRIDVAVQVARGI